MVETELKLALDPGAIGRLARAAPLAGLRPRRLRVCSDYFDTPAGELAARGMVLRLRRAGGRWIQGLKAANAAGGGLHVRHEWEFPRRDAGIDLWRFAGTPLADIDGAADLHRRLVPAFRVDMVRTLWILSPVPGSVLEVALDVGTVESRGRAEPVCELEIECLEGPPRAAFDLASALLDAVPLRLSTVTKAERGYRLFRGAARVPAKVAAVRLEAGLGMGAAACRVVASGLGQLQANEDGLLASPDPEFVHQARIALRRLRSALRIFRDGIGVARARQWRDALGEVSRALGSARDWDVFATVTFPAIAAAHGDSGLARRLASRLARRRRHEREAARAAVKGADYARAVLGIARWLAEEPAAPGPREPLDAFAARTIRKRHRRVLRAARDVGALSAPERHALRIEVKRLRYGTDALASLFRPGRVRPLLEALGDLQDALGRANDAATALRLLGELRPPESFAAFARGWLEAQSRPDPLLLEALAARLGDARRFWR